MQAHTVIKIKFWDTASPVLCQTFSLLAHHFQLGQGPKIYSVPVPNFPWFHPKDCSEITARLGGKPLASFEYLDTVAQPLELSSEQDDEWITTSLALKVKPGMTLYVRTGNVQTCVGLRASSPQLLIVLHPPSEDGQAMNLTPTNIVRDRPARLQWDHLRALESWSTDPDYHAFLATMMPDPVTGLDPPGAKIHAAEGMAPPVASSRGRSKIVENLAVVNYNTNHLHLAPFDWRLSYYNLEERDGYFSRLKTTIEGFKRRQNKKTVIAAHSMGALVRLQAPSPLTWYGNIWGMQDGAPDDTHNCTHSHGELIALWVADAGGTEPVATASDDGAVRVWDLGVPVARSLATGRSSGVVREFERAAGGFRCSKFYISP
ncbi:Lecithin:cholesterol acyltransferase-domain-containing protein [Mycena latifolia]|nr:Lecithin:cholesterol acyltransferase-domain-containing protein [Mycena latifolia]